MFLLYFSKLRDEIIFRFVGVLIMLIFVCIKQLCSCLVALTALNRFFVLSLVVFFLLISLQASVEFSSIECSRSLPLLPLPLTVPTPRLTSVYMLWISRGMRD